MRKLVKVECSKCGHISWWTQENNYSCKECGSKRGKIVNLSYDALRQRRLQIQLKTLAAQCERE